MPPALGQGTYVAFLSCIHPFIPSLMRSFTNTFTQETFTESLLLGTLSLGPVRGIEKETIILEYSIEQYSTEGRSECCENKEEVLTQLRAEQRGEGACKGTFPRKQTHGTESLHIRSTSASLSVGFASVLVLCALSNSSGPPWVGVPP